MRINPVLRRELIERWRGARATATVTAYLAVLGLLLYLLYQLGLAILRAEAGFGLEVGSGPAFGRFLFDGLLFLVLVMVLFVSPGYAATQLSGERDRRTLALLQLTLLRPYQIVLGKLGASVAWVLILVTVTLPLAAATLFLGGVSLAEVLRAGAFVLVVAISVAGIALGISSVTRRTTASIVLTYATVLALAGGTLFLAGAEFLLRVDGDEPARTPRTLYLNPFFGLADAARSPELLFAGSMPSALGLLASAHPDSAAIRESGTFVEDVAPGGGALLDGPVEQPGAPRRPVWLQVASLYILMGGAGLVVATRRLRSVERSGLVGRSGRRRRRGARSPDGSEFPPPGQWPESAVQAAGALPPAAPSPAQPARGPDPSGT